MKVFNHDEMNRLTQISKIIIFIKIFVNESVQTRRVGSLDSNF